MKVCIKCKETKPRSEFYRRVASKDGLEYWCKSCRRADTANREGKHVLAASTEKAVEILSQNGIPVTTGIVVGRPGKDLVAYGYISIEAKGSAAQHRKNGAYLFGLTDKQTKQYCDFYVLMCNDVNRCFIIPKESDVLHFGTALYVNINDPRLAQYENAFDLIKEKVLRDIAESKPVRSVRVASGARIKTVSISTNP